MKATLDVDLGGLQLRSPVMAASGCLRSLRDVHGLLDVRKLGAIVSETLTVVPLQGPLGPRASETPSGLLTATGAQNPGIAAFRERELPLLERAGVPVIASLAGGSVEDVIRVTKSLGNAPGVVAIELNLGFFSEERGGGMPAARGDHAGELVGAVARMSRFPVFAKLSADVGDVVDVARACVDAGAHGLTLINGVRGMRMVDDGRLAVPGWLSGPAIRPLAVRAIAEVARAMPNVPILGCGGVDSGSSARELLQAGAWAVQVGTAMLVRPDAPIEITKSILQGLKASGMASPDELRTRGIHAMRPVSTGATEATQGADEADTDAPDTDGADEG